VVPLENISGDSGKNKLYYKRAKQDSASVSTKPDQFLNSLISSVSWSPDWIQEPYAWAGHMPFAYWLMTESQPKVFVELGTHTGNSYFSFCQAVRDKGLTGRCFAVDTWQGDEQAGSYGEDVFEMVNRHNESQYKSFSTLYRMTFDEALAKFQDQSVDLLHIDGLHTYEAVRHDFESWLPKLAPGALVLFHDIKVTHGEFGVWKFWAELKEKYPQNFEFRHSHGLGVIKLPGLTPKSDLAWLRAGTPEKINLLEVMSVNGESLMAKARHKELERLASAAQTKGNEPGIEKPLNLELFFAQEGEPFSEKKKISEPILCRENEHSQIRIQLQGMATRSVLWRIDLGDQPAFFRVHELGFTAKNGKKIWRLTDHSDEAVIGGSAESLSGDGFVVCSFGKDPQILLPKLSLSSDDKLYEIRITLEVLNAKDCLPFLAKRYHELESQSRSNLATIKVALEQKEKEAINAQSRAKNFERIEKNISKHIGELKEELAQKQKSQQEAQKVATAKGLKELGDSMAALKQELIHELRGLVGGLNERQDQLQQQNKAEMDTLKSSLEDRLGKNESNLMEVAKYAEQIQDSVVAPSSYLIPAPFSWYSYLYKMMNIKKPRFLNKKRESKDTSNKPGFWRRLEQRIRKLRKRLVARIGFDREWYLEKNPDVKAHGIDPWEHYCKFGMTEGRKKNPKDNPKFKLQPPAPKDYAEWIKKYETLTDADREKMSLLINAMDHPPVFSVVIPVFNPQPNWLRRAIESVRKQIYPHWQICLVDDASTDSEVVKIIREESAHDPRITFGIRGKNGGIAVASNEALGLARGDWVTFLDHDDELKEDALFWVAQSICNRPETVIIYTDEDKIDELGNRFDPHFKPEWNPELLLSYNYFCHLLAIRKDLIEQVGGFRAGFDGAQDYDLVLRCIAEAGQKNLQHIPRILYHWRAHLNSTAQDMGSKPKAQEAGRTALAEYLHRQGIKGTVSCINSHYRVKYALNVKPKVSILIPTRDQPNVLRLCVDSLREKTEYQNYEIILIDNNTTDAHASALLRKYESNGLTVLRDNKLFNYSRLNNIGAKRAKGDLLLLLNNDIEVKNGDWLENMVIEICQKNVGVVGAKLVYPDGRLQHGGVILGVGGIAGHAHKYLSSSLPGYFSRAQVRQEISAVTAACMLIRKELFHKVKGLDEVNLKVAFNDVDLCLRAREEGWRVVWTPFAELLHHESASRGPENTPEKHARFVSEITFMKNKWGKKLFNDTHYNPNLTLESEDFSLAFPPRVRRV
jgi:GT2 family glycosyltransferase